MKNSTAVEICSDPSSENYLDQDFLKDIQKRSRKSGRWITCQLCGKTITRVNMGTHFNSFHASDLGEQK